MKIQERLVPPCFRAHGNALICIAACLASSLFQLAVMAQPLPEWSCFHGPERTNKSSETGLLSEWPEEGPELIWTISGLGRGYSNVSLADGYIFTSGSTERQTYVFAFGLDGQLIWKKPNGIPWETERSWARTYNGARSTPTHSEGLVYHLGELGRLAALDARSGDEVWSIELREQFDAEIPEYGFFESVHIEGDRLYCCPAGKKAFLVCLDKYTGQLVWANTEIQGTVGFSSLIIFDHGGYRQIAGLSSNCVFGVDTRTRDGMHWAHPVVCGGKLYIRHQAKLFAYNISPRIN